MSFFVLLSYRFDGFDVVLMLMKRVVVVDVVDVFAQGRQHSRSNSRRDSVRGQS